jgi:hypothetical protein
MQEDAPAADDDKPTNMGKLGTNIIAAAIATLAT